MLRQQLGQQVCLITHAFDPDHDSDTDLESIAAGSTLEYLLIPRVAEG